MDKITERYRMVQMEQVDAPCEFKRQIKITRPLGNTNWLSITEEEFQAIKKILIEGK